MVNKCSFTALLLIVLFLAACSPNNVTIDSSLKAYFDSSKVDGCFGLYDNGSGQFTIYNLNRYKDSAYLPASTFKIVNSLVGIEIGRIVNERMVIKWDGVVRIFPGGDTAKAWNKDLTMEEAFKASAVPYYQEVARRIGRDTMQHWLDSLKYGNKKIGSHIDSFWLDNTLKITPDEQLGLVKKLYFGQLGFQKRTQDIVKKVMLQESNANYRLSYKTGWGFKENGNSVGWTVGWIEENHHPYFFVLNIEGPHIMDMPTIRKNILTSILKKEDFFEGRK
ncbi:class D beta-lactamase [Parasediminibacterium sp. JCM 36343]|uniref:class D beta-lactamase n=1 Tax=Parasediminibacterium sp. JCM 36343 TaxID=3374279 RepID=UPI00397D4858